MEEIPVKTLVEKNHPKSKKIKQDLLSVFYPDDNEWKMKAWLNGMKIVVEFMGYQ